MRPGPLDFADVLADIRLTLASCFTDLMAWAQGGRHHFLRAWARR